MSRHLIAACLGLLLVAGGTALAEPFPGTPGDFHGFKMYTDAESGRRVVVPKQAAEGTPWVWRARFWGHEPQFDIAMLERGFHIVSCDVAGLFGSPRAVAIGDVFYADLVEQHHFSSKPVLEGMSRGGLFIYNWAAANPEKVTAIYGDAPVLDFKSWPGGPRAAEEGAQAAAWQECLQAYGLSEEEALSYPRNPVDNLEPLAKAGIPIVHVVGDADEVVPVADNTAVAESRYRKLGGTFIVIHKPGVGHHPHSLEDPSPLVEFVMAAWERAHSP